MKHLIINLKQLNVVRDTTELLSSIDWNIKSGEHWVILGANGSGKSSLIKVLTGYLTPTSGYISVLNKIYGDSDYRDLRLMVGIITHSLQSSIPEGETILETVISGLYAQLNLWKNPTRNDILLARRLIRKVGLTHLVKRPWSFLSQGERQRVLIARALINNPKLLILDEPCAGLDPVAREEFLSLISKLSKQKNGPTLIFVTHHIEEILPQFTHALILKKGRIFSQGKVNTQISSRILSLAFNTQLQVIKKAKRYRLAF
jgi:iron complex transport system ATP-binding protein